MTVAIWAQALHHRCFALVTLGLGVILRHFGPKTVLCCLALAVRFALVHTQFLFARVGGYKRNRCKRVAMAHPPKFHGDNAINRPRTREEDMPDHPSYQCWWCDSCGVTNAPVKLKGVLVPRPACFRHCDTERVKYNGGWCGFYGEAPPQWTYPVVPGAGPEARVVKAAKRNKKSAAQSESWRGNTFGYLGDGHLGGCVGVWWVRVSEKSGCQSSFLRRRGVPSRWLQGGKVAMVPDED